MEKGIHKITNENKILLMLAFMSISLGIWGNFRQLWLQNYGLEVTQISNTLSLGSLICIIGIIIFSKKIKISSLKIFVCFALILKVLVLLVLFLCHDLNLLILVRILVMIDIIIENLLIISIYPLIVTIKKDDVFYSKRKLVEYLFRDVGILIGGMVIGRTIAGIIVDYNFCLFISILFLIIAFLVATRNKE